MTGPEGFAKPRSQLLFSDSIKPVEQGGLGLEPLDPNYVNMMKANIWEKLRYLTGQYIKSDYIDAGFIKREKVPAWVELQDKTMKGYYAHPDVARVLDNYLSSGLRGDPLFELYNTPATFLNTVFVGFSAFHATFSILSDLSLGIGNNLTQAIGAALTGRFDLAGKHLGNLAKATNVPGNLLTGGKLMEEYAKPGTHPELSEIVDLMTKGGIRVNATEMQQMARSFAEALRDSKFTIPRKMVNAVSWPIMNWLVPRIKMNAIARSLKMELELAQQREGKALTKEQQVKIAQEVARRGDDIFGQMVYDNLSMTRGWRDALRILIGFPGWNIGSGTLILEGMKGITHLISETSRGGAELAMGRKPTWQAMSRKSRMGIEFYVGMALVMSVFGAMTQRLLTGEWPTGMKDLFMPRTGGTLPNGQPERVRPPTYMRDILSLHHPIEMVTHKLNFPLRMFATIAQNQDYFGKEVRAPWAPLGEQAMQTARYAGKSFLPFGIQGYLKTDDPRAKALNLIGITPVPRQYTNTPAQNIIDEYNKLHRASVTTKEDAATKKLKGELVKMGRGQDQAGFEEKAQGAISEGKLTRQQVKEIVNESQGPPGMGRFTRLPIEWATRAMEAASDYEREQWTPYFLKKLAQSKPETLIHNRESLVSLLKEMGENKVADRIQNLEIPEEVSRIDLTGLGITKPSPEMASIDEVDQAIADSIGEKLEFGLQKPKKGGLRFPRLVKKESDKKKAFRTLGF